MNRPENPNRDDSVEFLLAEFNQITEETRRLREEGLNRLNFFITLTSSVLAGLVLFSQVNVMSAFNLQLVSIGALIFLILMGWSAFRFTISRDISTDLNIRATGRIRRFFIDRDPLIGSYVTWQQHDEPTRWVTKNTSNLRTTIQSILSLLFALLAGLAANLILGQIFWSIGLGVIGFGAALLLLPFYARKRFETAAKAAESMVRFPQTVTKE